MQVNAESMRGGSFRGGERKGQKFKSLKVQGFNSCGAKIKELLW